MSKTYKVAVIGDSMVDYRRWSSTSRPSPEAPDCSVLTGVQTKAELGGAANVARWLAMQQDLEVHLYCHWAADETGDALDQLCRINNINLSKLCARDGNEYTTTRKERICRLSDTEFQQIVRCDNDTNCIIQEPERKLIQREVDASSFDIIVVADYKKGMFADLQGQHMESWLSIYHPERLIINSKCPQRWSRRSIHTLICNRQEAFADWDDLTPTGPVRCQQMVVTLGPGGVVCNRSMEAESSMRMILHMPTLADNVIDVTGAGDAFTAGFAYSVLRRPQLAGHAGSKEQEVKQWIHEGQRWAAHCCAQIGCGTPLRGTALAVPEATTEGSTDAVTV